MVDRTLLICGSILIIAIILFAGSGILLMTDNNAKIPSINDNLQKYNKKMNGPSNNPESFDRHNQGQERDLMKFSENKNSMRPDSTSGRNDMPCQRGRKSNDQGQERLNFMKPSENKNNMGPDSISGRNDKPCQRDRKSNDQGQERLNFMKPHGERFCTGGHDSATNEIRKPCQNKPEDNKNNKSMGNNKENYKGELKKGQGISQDKGINQKNVGVIYICYTQPDSNGNMLVHIEKKNLP